MTNPQQPPAGWYDDPSGTARQRWWDGTAWTDHYQARPARAWAPGSATIPSSDRTWIVAAHGSAFLGAWLAVAFVGPLVVYLVRRDDPVVRPHAAAALNFQLSWLLYGFVAGVVLLALLWVSDAFDAFPAVAGLAAIGGAIWLAITLVATIRAARGTGAVRYPLAIPFVR